MDGELNFFRNSIHTVKENVPELVWDHYNEKVSDAIGKMNLTQSKRNSYRNTYKRYASGELKGDTIYGFNHFFKEEILKILPIWSMDFFHGEFEQMEIAAKETAKAMIKDFEDLLEAQKSKITA